MTPIHLLFLFGALPAIAYADHAGFQWVRGKKPTVNSVIMTRIHWWIYACLAGIISTGTLMVLNRPDRYLNNPAFFLKMFFVVTLLVNSVFIGGLMKKAVKTPFSQLSIKTQRAILGSAIVSSLAWAARYLAVC